MQIIAHKLLKFKSDDIYVEIRLTKCFDIALILNDFIKYTYVVLCRVYPGIMMVC